jgi:translation initiation factor 1
MANTDWKSFLGNLKTEDTNEQQNAKENPVHESEIKHEKDKRQDLIIRFERRNGKPATIISNFMGTENELKELARSLKTICGSGGSAKDDEILIQGDFRQKIAHHLKNLGHKVKGDFK